MGGAVARCPTVTPFPSRPPSSRATMDRQPNHRGVTMRYTLALIVLLAACSSAAPVAPGAPVAATAATTATASATMTATPTPTVWTKAEAAAQYLAIVKAPNDARAALKAQLDAHPKDAKPLPDMCQALANSLKGFIDALAAGRWPTDARPAVDDVMASVAADMNSAIQCARGKTIADFNAAWATADPKPGSAQVLRAKLGLPAAG